MKKALLALCALPMFCFGAVQATKEYCDNNRERAVQEAYEQVAIVLPDMVGPSVTNYMDTHGIPQQITNTEHRIVNIYTISNFIEHIETVISNHYDYFYIITNTTVYTTNVHEFVVAVQEETNTTFTVGTDGLLAIDKSGEQVWKEKDSMSADQIRQYVNNYVDPKVEQQNAIIATWEGFLDGSNVVFSITNYLSGSYNIDTAKLRIMELRDGEYREVYNSRDEIMLHINALSNSVDTMVEEQLVPIREELNQKGDAAWGRRSSTGQPVPISNTVWVTEQSLRISGGMEYERVAVGEGSIFVLTSKGQSSYVQGDEGSLLLHDDGSTNYFGMVKSDSYTVGCNTDEITTGNQMVNLGYNIDLPAGNHPCIWYMASLENYDPDGWEQLNTSDGEPVPGASHEVTWEASSGDMHQECHINVGTAPSGFFRATIEVSGAAKFKTNMNVDAPAYFTSDGNHKVIIDWNNGNPKLTPVND